GPTGAGGGRAGADAAADPVRMGLTLGDRCLSPLPHPRQWRRAWKRTRAEPPICSTAQSLTRPPDATPNRVTYVRLRHSPTADRDALFWLPSVSRGVIPGLDSVPRSSPSSSRLRLTTSAVGRRWRVPGATRRMGWLSWRRVVGGGSGK